MVLMLLPGLAMAQVGAGDTDAVVGPPVDHHLEPQTTTAEAAPKSAASGKPSPRSWEVVVNLPSRGRSEAGNATGGRPRQPLGRSRLVSNIPDHGHGLRVH